VFGRRSLNRKAVQLARNCSNKNVFALRSLICVELYRRSILQFSRRKQCATAVSASAVSRPGN
jgi:hypothetical protein